MAPIFQGYATGQFAPQVCTNRTKCAFGNSSIDAYVAAHNVLRSHAAVVDLYKTKYQVGTVSAGATGGVRGMHLSYSEFGCLKRDPSGRRDYIHVVFWSHKRLY